MHGSGRKHAPYNKLEVFYSTCHKTAIEQVLAWFVMR